jgi:hypothetical protein
LQKSEQVLTSIFCWCCFFESIATHKNENLKNY